MIKSTTKKRLILMAIVLLSIQSIAQELTTIGETPIADSLLTSNLRAKTVIMVGAGSTLLNRNINSPDYENFIQIQLKRFISPSFNINGNLKKFDIKNYDFETHGFLSGDLNLEWYVIPNSKLTPYIYLGAGILTSNDFEDQNYKIQGGFGLDYLLTNKIAITGALETNYIYDEQKGSQLLQEADHLYFNALLGLHLYIGNTKSSARKKIKKNQASTINSNRIEMN